MDQNPLNNINPQQPVAPTPVSQPSMTTSSTPQPQPSPVMAGSAPVAPAADNQMVMQIAKYGIAAIVVFGLAFGGLYYYKNVYNQGTTTEELTPSAGTKDNSGAIPLNDPQIPNTTDQTPAPKLPTQYKNTEFKYAVTANPDWRIAEDYTGQVNLIEQTMYLYGTVGCPADMYKADVEKYKTCVSSKSSSITPKVQDYQSKYSLASASYIAFTNEPQDKELTWLTQLQKNNTKAGETEAGKVIEVYPAESDIVLGKDTPANSTSKVKLTTITLTSGVKALQADAREASPSGGLTISVPNKASWAKGVTFRTFAVKDSVEEKAFFEFVNTLVVGDASQTTKTSTPTDTPGSTTGTGTDSEAKTNATDTKNASTGANSSTSSGTGSTGDTKTTPTSPKTTQ